MDNFYYWLYQQQMHMQQMGQYGYQPPHLSNQELHPYQNPWTHSGNPNLIPQGGYHPMVVRPPPVRPQPVRRPPQSALALSPAQPDTPPQPGAPAQPIVSVQPVASAQPVVPAQGKSPAQTATSIQPATPAQTDCPVAEVEMQLEAEATEGEIIIAAQKSIQRPVGSPEKATSLEKEGE